MVQGRSRENWEQNEKRVFVNRPIPRVKAHDRLGQQSRLLPPLFCFSIALIIAPRK
jgi:hypothetical protein